MDPRRRGTPCSILILALLLFGGSGCAAAIAVYGPGSGAALATVVGVLVEVPVMLSVCAVCNRTRAWFESAEEGKGGKSDHGLWPRPTDAA